MSGGLPARCSGRSTRVRRDRHAQPARGQQRLQRRADRGHAGGAGRARAASRASARCVIRGNGKHFQAGADLTWIGAVARRLARGRTPRVARDRRGGARLNACAGADRRAGAGAAASAAAPASSRPATSWSRPTTRMFSIAEVRWGLTAATDRSAACRCDRRAAAAPLRAHRRALRRRGGAPHRARAPGRCRCADLRREGARIVEHLLQNGPGAVAETKAWILRVGLERRRRHDVHRAGREPCRPAPSRPRPPRASPRSPRSAPPRWQ